MDFSKLEAGKMMGRFQPTDFTAFTRDLAGLFRNAIDRAGLTYIINCEDAEGRICRIDTDLADKIIGNLIG